jgi:hypothetical protein
MPTLIVADVINLKELQRAFGTAPALVTRNIRGELGRFAKRVRRKTIRERMSGRPGIDGGQFKRGKHVQAFVTGSELGNLKAVNKISRILRVHEEGGVINPQRGAWLYLSKKTGVKGKGRIFARVKQVVIPARLGFEMVWRREKPDGIKRIAAAMERGVREAIDKQFKEITRTVQRLAA